MRVSVLDRLSLAFALLALGTCDASVTRRALLHGSVLVGATQHANAATGPVCYGPKFEEIPCESQSSAAVGSGGGGGALATKSVNGALDVNNMVGVEFTTFPGLYPTISGKLVKAGPFKDKADVYAALGSDAERNVLKAYDKNLVIRPRDDDVMQYKNAGFYFPGKGGSGDKRKKSSESRDEMIKDLQRDRKGVS